MSTVPEIRLPDRTSAVAAAADFVEAEAERAGWSAADVTRVVLAACEAVSNAVEHGPADGAVRVRCTSGPDALRLDVADGGGGPRAARLAAAALPSGPLAPGGRGLYIMRTVADEVSVADGVLTLQFVRAGRA